MADKDTTENPVIRVGDKLSDAFDELQDRIRERAYHMFLGRDADEGDPISDWLRAQAEELVPASLEVKEQKTNVVVEAVLKDFSSEEIEIEVEGDVLKVLGSHRESESREDDESTESSSKAVYFYQSVTLPCPVDLDKSHAKLFKNGKLKVTLPRKKK